MMTIIGAIAGLLLGSGAGYFIVNTIIKKTNQSKIDEINKQTDLEVEKARINAQRITAEAENKAEKIISKAEQKNESIKQQKIQESKDNFNRLKSEFESQKSSQLIELKERELKTQVLEKEVNAKKQDIENRETELKTVRENLEMQLKIVQKKKEELEDANEKKIKQLEQIAKMTEAEAKESMLQAVRAKATNDALSIEREVIENAKANANKEAKKIVIQTIQRMCAEYTIENSVSV
ncbi:MAG: Rnase Y domain-containing protein, partial [Saprospiraceae bacterium]